MFENSSNSFEFDPTLFLSTPALACQACVKRIEIELELLRNINMLQRVEKGI